MILNSVLSPQFNLAIRDIPEVLSETKRALASQLISVKQSLCIEISLKTADGDTMVLEVWSLGMVDQYDPNVKVSYMVYNRMGVLLKSLFCVSRVTPAYRLSRAQGPDNYVICYRIFLGEPSLNHLGDGHVSRKVGAVPTPIGRITLSVSFRTKLLISPQHSCRDLGIELKENHFKPDSPKKITPPKPCQFARVRERRYMCVRNFWLLGADFLRLLTTLPMSFVMSRVAVSPGPMRFCRTRKIHIFRVLKKVSESWNLSELSVVNLRRFH